MSEAETQTHRFEAEVSQVMSLVINSLYSNKEIFLRELVSNAADALDKLRFQALTDADLKPLTEGLRIRITPDREAGTLSFDDNGIGMSHDELVANLGTIARSGSRAFVEEAIAAKKEGAVDLIGQFGVGFYSAYLVADSVTVVSRAAGSDEAWRWDSDAGSTFTVAPAERESHGTTVTLHLREDEAEYLELIRLRTLVERYSDFVEHPIELPVEKAPPGDDDDEADVADAAPEYKQANEAGALWKKSSSDVTDEQYAEFYKHISHDWQDPAARTHFTVEGMQMFTGLLFIPSMAPFDLFDREAEHGVRLYVKRVFIMDRCEDLLPRWLRFVRGVIDSDDLPLNVSRELLQDSRAVRSMRKHIVKKVLEAIEGLEGDTFETFWNHFGRVLKEGVHFDADFRPRLAKLLRYESSAGPGLVSLEEYVERMKDGQKDIYCAVGATRKLIESSPHIEALRKRGYEVLFFTDTVDPWVLDSLREFDDKRIVNIMAEGVDLDDDASAEEIAEREKQADDFKPLLDRFESVLKEHISEVRVSTRLETSPVCLMLPEGGMPAHIERMLRAQNADLPVAKRVLEINPDHHIVSRLRTLEQDAPGSERVVDTIEVLYNQALLAEGSPLEDPAGFAAKVTQILTDSI